MASMRYHPSVTIDRVIRALDRYANSLDNPGICVECGKDANEVEPDAREYECQYCGKNAVYGAQELVIMMA